MQGYYKRKTINQAKNNFGLCGILQQLPLCVAFFKNCTNTVLCHL